jgi:hypothetical protein
MRLRAHLNEIKADDIEIQARCTRCALPLCSSSSVHIQ